MKKSIIIIFSVLFSFFCLGQNSFDISLNLGTRTGFITYHDLLSPAPSLNKQYAIGLSPLYVIDGSYTFNTYHLGIRYEGGEMLLKRGFNLQNTENYKGGGIGSRNGVKYHQGSLFFGYIYRKHDHLEQSVNLQGSFLYLEENNTITPLFATSYGYDSIGVLIESDNGYTEGYNFKKVYNLYLGFNYNLKYLLQKGLFFNFNALYNQGLFTVYSNDSQFNYRNHQTGYEVSFDQRIQTKLSHVTVTIGVGYKFFK